MDSILNYLCMEMLSEEINNNNKRKLNNIMAVHEALPLRKNKTYPKET